MQGIRQQVRAAATVRALAMSIALALGFTVGFAGVRSPVALAYSPVSWVDTTGDKQILMVDGSPFFYNGAQWSLVRTLDRDGWSWTDSAQIFAAAANSNFTVIGVPIEWSHIEPTKNTFVWTDLERAIDYAYSNGLKLELLWFGSQISTVSVDTIGTPSYVISDYQKVVRSDGSVVSGYSSHDQITNSPSTAYKMDMTDSSLLAREEYVLQTVMNHVRSYIVAQSYPNVVVGVQLLNEPTVAFMYRPNIAMSATATATSSAALNPASFGNDGTTSNGWVSANSPSFPQYLTLNWSTAQRITGVTLQVGYGQGQGPTNYDVQVSTDGSTNWTTVASYTPSYSYNDGTIEESPGNTIGNELSPITGKKGVRIKINNANLTWGHVGVNEVLIASQTDRSHSSAANTKWTNGSYTDVDDFNSDVMWDYLNGLGDAVKTSDYSTWTRANFWYAPESTMINDLITKNETARSGSGTNIDFLGNDPYDSDPNHIYDAVRDTSVWHHGKNLAMVMENAASYTNDPQLRFNALAGDGVYHVWEINDTLPNAAGLYTTNNGAKTISAKGHQSAVANFNGMLKKDAADLAALTAGGPNLAYYNRGFAASSDSARSVCGIAVRYVTSSTGGGIAACRSGALVLMSSAAGSFRVPASLPIASVQRGYYDASNAWVNSATVTPTASGSEKDIALSAYDCVRVVFGGGSYTDLALTATASATSVGSGAASLANDGDETTGYVSANSPSFSQYLTFTWASGQTFSSVVTKVWYAQGQAPTSFDVEVSTDGSTNWTNVASVSSLTYAQNNTTMESVPISFPQQSGKKGVRLKINGANLTWGHFGVNAVVVTNP